MTNEQRLSIIDMGSLRSAVPFASASAGAKRYHVLRLYAFGDGGGGGPPAIVARPQLTGSLKAITFSGSQTPP